MTTQSVSVSTQIKCPHCNKLFEPSEAYKHELEERLLQGEQLKHQEEIQKLKLLNKEIFESKEKEVEDAKRKAVESVREEVEGKVNQELKDKEDQIESLKKRAEEAEEEEEEAPEIWNTHQSLGALAFWLPVHSDLALDNTRAHPPGQQVCPAPITRRPGSAKTQSRNLLPHLEPRTEKGGLAATRWTHDRHQPA